MSLLCPSTYVLYVTDCQVLVPWCSSWLTFLTLDVGAGGDCLVGVCQRMWLGYWLDLVI